MTNWKERTEKVIGKDGSEKLKNSSVIVYGLGGVGSYVAESLARVGLGRIGIVDRDFVDITNKNRQLIALDSTLGLDKVSVLKKRLLDINSEIIVEAYKINYSETSQSLIDLKNYDFIADAIDDVKAKLLLIKNAEENKIPIISSMGTGNKLDPSKLIITKISKTHTDPLARRMRKLLKDINLDPIVIYSTEKPNNLSEDKRTPGSTQFVPPSAGLMIGSYIVRELLK